MDVEVMGRRKIKRRSLCTIVLLWLSVEQQLLLECRGVFRCSQSWEEWEDHDTSGFSNTGFIWNFRMAKATFCHNVCFFYMITVRTQLWRTLEWRISHMGLQAFCCGSSIVCLFFFRVVTNWKLDNGGFGSRMNDVLAAPDVNMYIGNNGGKCFDACQTTHLDLTGLDVRLKSSFFFSSKSCKSFI